jgi:hypothetical protein
MPASNLHAQVPTASGLTVLAHCSLCVSFVGLGIIVWLSNEANFLAGPAYTSDRRTGTATKYGSILDGKVERD